MTRQVKIMKKRKKSKLLLRNLRRHYRSSSIQGGHRIMMEGRGVDQGEEITQ
jgi:hypothetical protein